MRKKTYCPEVLVCIAMLAEALGPLLKVRACGGCRRASSCVRLSA